MKNILLALIASCLIAAAHAGTHAKAWVSVVSGGDPILKDFRTPINSGDGRTTTAAEAVASVRSSEVAFAEYSIGDDERVVAPPFNEQAHKISLVACGYVHGAKSGAYIRYGFPGREGSGSLALAGDQGGIILAYPTDDGSSGIKRYLVLVLALPQAP